MAQWASQIRNARNNSEQISVLRALKNQLIGHPAKKEISVASGVLDPVVRLVYNRPTSRNSGKAHDHTFASKPLDEEESVRLQGLNIIASIAAGTVRITYLHIPLLTNCQAVHHFFHDSSLHLSFLPFYQTFARPVTLRR